MRRIALSAATVVSLAGHAQAQSITNGTFATDLGGWNVANTSNGVGAPGAVVSFDIDGPGPLTASPAAQFSVGQAVFTSGSQQGIEMTQSLYLVGGLSYTFDFDWAADNTATTGSNAEGGVFSLIVNGAVVSTQGSGSIPAGTTDVGHIGSNFVPPSSGAYTVGVRITRPYTAPGTLQQYVDNFTLTLPPGTYNEPGDTGELPGTAQVITGGGGALRSIAGTIADGNADMFQIRICAPTSFGATTVGMADFDTQLFLFRPDGRGIAHNDDSAGGTRSTLTNLFTAAIPAGPYLLALSGYNRDPRDVANNFIWLNTPFNTERAPDGPGAANPINNWDGANGGGAYTIALTGACTLAPCVSVSGLIGGPSTGWPSSHGTQTTRVFRDGVPDDCVTSAIGGSAISGNYTYDRYVFYNNTNAPACIQVDVNTTCTGTSFIYAAAYVGGYNPANPDANHAASLGSSPNPTASMSFTVPANSPFEVVFTNVTAGTLCTSPYQFRVTGSCPLNPQACYANCDGSTIPPILNVNDFICFQSRYAANDPYANCDGSTIPPVLNVNDFICFQSAYAAGCP